MVIYKKDGTQKHEEKDHIDQKYFNSFHQKRPNYFETTKLMATVPEKHPHRRLVLVFRLSTGGFIKNELPHWHSPRTSTTDFRVSISEEPTLRLLLQ